MEAEIYCHVYKKFPLLPVLIHVKQFYILLLCFFKNNFNIILTRYPK
jgi:hypothetical protein